MCSLTRIYLFKEVRFWDKIITFVRLVKKKILINAFLYLDQAQPRI